MSTQVKRSELSEVAKELNQVMGLEPEINTAAKVKDLKEKVMEAGQHIDPQEDEFTESTWEIMENLGAAFRPAEEYTPDRSGEQEEEESQEEQPKQKSVSEEESVKEQIEGQETENVTTQDGQQTDDQVEHGEGLEAQDQSTSEEQSKKSGKQTTGKSPIGNKRFRDDQTIKVLAKENPKKEGSKSYDRFNLYKSDITVKQYVEAGGKRDDLRWDSERGHIQIQ